MASHESPGTDLTYNGYRPGSIRPDPQTDGMVFNWNQSPFWSRTNEVDGTAYAMSVGLIERLKEKGVTRVEINGDTVPFESFETGELITPDDELFDGKQSPEEPQRIVIV